LRDGHRLQRGARRQNIGHGNGRGRAGTVVAERDGISQGAADQNGVGRRRNSHRQVRRGWRHLVSGRRRVIGGDKVRLAGSNGRGRVAGVIRAQIGWLHDGGKVGLGASRHGPQRKRQHAALLRPGALGRGGGNERRAGGQQVRHRHVCGAAGAKIGDRDGISEVVLGNRYGGLTDDADGHIGAGALTAAVSANRGREEQGPAVNHGITEPAGVGCAKLPGAIDVGAGFAGENRERLGGAVGAQKRRHAGADGR